MVKINSNAVVAKDVLLEAVNGLVTEPIIPLWTQPNPLFNGSKYNFQRNALKTKSVSTIDKLGSLSLNLCQREESLSRRSEARTPQENLHLIRDLLFEPSPRSEIPCEEPCSQDSSGKP